MSTEALRSTLSDAFSTAWAARYPAIKVSFENRKFTQPRQVSWADFNLVQSYRTRMNIGTKRFVRTKGMIVIEIYAPEDQGTRVLYEMADYIGQELEDTVYPMGNGQHATTHTSKQTHDGSMEGFYRQTVIVPFISDEAFNG